MAIRARFALFVPLAITVCGVAPGCVASSDQDAPQPAVDSVAQSLDASAFPAHYARQWMVNMQNAAKFDGISPPVAARTYTYTSIAMYEAIVHGIPGGASLAGQLNGLGSLPTPSPSLQYDWPVVLAHTMDRLVRADYPGTAYVFPPRIFYEFTTFSQASLWLLGPTQIGYRRTAGVSEQVIQNSTAYADELADALIPWILADGYLDLRYKGFISPQGPQYWVPTGFSDTDKVSEPIEPHFGDVRTLVLTDGDECAPPPPPAFSTDPASVMYQQANEVFQTEQTLTDEQMDTARYWADGPKDTSTPAGHWVGIATQFLRNKTLAEAVTGYAKTSLGYFDSFIAIWKSKYRYNLLRPETYIRRHIKADWRPFLPTPQFPEYVSGHSGQSMAAAVLFTSAFGAGPFTDNTKTRRGFAARTFNSFTDAGIEASLSRLYGGIHYTVGNANGRTLGVCVGNTILSRVHFTQ